MMIFAAVDGTGLTYYESAGLMKALGCYDALDFDGGGSTAIWSEKFGIYNKPRDGSERAIGNALYFTLKAPVDKVVTSIRFADFRMTLPHYASYTPVIFGYNQYGQLVDTDVKDFTLEAPEALGTTDGSTLLASGTGTHALKVRKGDMESTVVITIDDSFPATPRFESMLLNTVKPLPIELVAKVGIKDMPVAPQAFEWVSSNPEVATVNDDFQIVGITDGTATITGTCADITVAINVTVENPERLSRSLLSAEAEWSTSGSGTKAVELKVDENGVVDYDYTVTSTRGTKVTVKQPFRLYSRPDFITYKADLPGVEVTRVQASVTPNGLRPVSIDAVDGKFDVSLAGLECEGNESAYPLTFQSITFGITATAGTYHLNLSELSALYLDYPSGVEDVNVTEASSLNYAVNGLTVNVFNTASAVRLYSLTGTCVAQGVGCVTAPAAGLYILHSANGVAKVMLAE